MSTTLVAFFSPTGTTARAALALADTLGADTFEIKPQQPYTAADLDWRDEASRTSVEKRDETARPTIVGTMTHMDRYDTVFVGFPIWWYVEPRIIDTFLETYNFTGKTVIPFATSGGSGLGQAPARMQSIIPGARVLEVSSRSEEELGVRLSAFNLMMTWGNGARISVESAFQGSKVFEQGGPYRDLWGKSSRDAKRDPRLRSSGGIVGFQFGDKRFASEPKTFFYDWLYIHTLAQEENAALAEGILAYDAFTDIEFNPKRSINCQAEAAAIFVSLSRRGLLRDALESEDGFREIVFQGVASETAADPAGGQGHLF